MRLYEKESWVGPAGETTDKNMAVKKDEEEEEKEEKETTAQIHIEREK